MNILVTGAGGQLGKELIYLSSDFTECSFHFCNSSELDIRSEEKVTEFISEHNIDTVINCAAYTKVDDAEEEQELANEINHLAVKKLANTCKNQEIRLIHFSTDYVFSGENFQPYKTHQPCEPVNYYGRSKVLGEKAILEKAGKNQFIVRTSWVYSPFGHNFVKTMLRLGETKNEISVVTDQVGSPTNARDLAQFVLEHLVAFETEEPLILHYTNSGVCSWYDFATTIIHIQKLSCDVKPIASAAFPTKAKRPFYSVLDKSLLNSHFNHTPKNWMISLEKSLQKNDW